MFEGGKCEKCTKSKKCKECIEFKNLKIIKKCKGVKKSVVKKGIRNGDYKTSLFKGKKHLRKMNVIRSNKHEVYTEEVNKLALSADDDKRYILKDCINTLALRHYRIS